jgi:hypothetical protein
MEKSKLQMLPRSTALCGSMIFQTPGTGRRSRLSGSTAFVMFRSRNMHLENPK